MSIISFLLASLVSVSTTYAQRGGVCYDPFHVGTSSFSAETISRDMQQIKANGFTHVRTFSTIYGDVELGPIIAQAGLKGALGVPIQGLSPDDIQHQLAIAIEAANNNQAQYIFVGNENLVDASAVPAELFDYIAYVQDNVPSTVKVGTVQRSTEFLDPNHHVEGFESLLDLCQIVGVNIHPFFSPNLAVQDAMTNVKNQWQAVLSQYNTIADKLALTEVGWPSDGEASNTYGSMESAQTFLNDFTQWAIAATAIPPSNLYYFQMYDQPYRAEKEPIYEAKFGLFGPNGVEKLVLPPINSTGPKRIEAQNYAGMSGVTTEPCSEGGQNVGFIDEGDWMYYPITIPTTGPYQISYRVSSIYTGRYLSAEYNAGEVPLGNVTIPNTGSWQIYTTVSHVVTLPAGNFNFGLNGGNGGWNIHWLEIVFSE